MTGGIILGNGGIMLDGASGSPSGDFVPIRSIQTESGDFALGSGENLLIHRVASTDPVTVDCDALVIGATAAVEWYGSGKVTLAFSGQVLNANDRLMSLKERGARVFVYRTSADELQVLNPDNLQSNAAVDPGDILFELINNNTDTATLYDTRGTGAILANNQGTTSFNIDLTGGCAIAIKYRLKRFPSFGDEPILEGDNYSRFINGYGGSADFYFFRYYFGGTYNADIRLNTFLTPAPDVGDWIRVLISINSSGDATIYINDVYAFGAVLLGSNYGTTVPNKLKFNNAGAVIGTLRVWDRELTGDEITEQKIWLNNH